MKMLGNNCPETDTGVPAKSNGKKNPKNIQKTTKTITDTNKFQIILPGLSLLTIDKYLFCSINFVLH